MPLALLARRRIDVQLVIFDCDGVLVDSEAIASRVVAEALTAEGWVMSTEQAQTLFLGMSLPDMLPLISRHMRRPLPASWPVELAGRLTETLAREAIAIPGAIDALHAVSAMGLPWRVASNSSHAEMRTKFAALGISTLVDGRLHSFEDVARGKPAPDLFLATAKAQGVTPDACVVIEDSARGARAAAAAGMDCLGYAAHTSHAELIAEGAAPFRSMFDLPELLLSARRASA